VKIRDKVVGDECPVFIIAEIGINHNGDVQIAKKLIDAAHRAGCDAVKFQARTPDKCVPVDQRDVIRKTPWGEMTYLEYRHRIELGVDEYRIIDGYCRQKGMMWFASCWDEEALELISQFDPPCYKIASACLTDDGLLKAMRDTGKPLILSTGMSTMVQIRHAVKILGEENLIILHCNSTYPCPVNEINLRTIETLRRTFRCPVGYSGHEVGLPTTIATVALGVSLIERHITVDRSMWGSDQAASVEATGFERLVRGIRSVEAALGDGVKRIYPGELEVIKRLRKFI